LLCGGGEQHYLISHKKYFSRVWRGKNISYIQCWRAGAGSQDCLEGAGAINPAKAGAGKILLCEKIYFPCTVEISFLHTKVCGNAQRSLKVTDDLFFWKQIYEYIYTFFLKIMNKAFIYIILDFCNFVYCSIHFWELLDQYQMILSCPNEQIILGYQIKKKYTHTVEHCVCEIYTKHRWQQISIIK
jgi:hypothetical protein